MEAVKKHAAAELSTATAALAIRQQEATRAADALASVQAEIEAINDKIVKHDGGAGISTLAVELSVARARETALAARLDDRLTAVSVAQAVEVKAAQALDVEKLGAATAALTAATDEIYSALEESADAFARKLSAIELLRQKAAAIDATVAAARGVPSSAFDRGIASRPDLLSAKFGDMLRDRLYAELNVA